MFSRDLHAYLRALMGPDALRVGPFSVSFDRHDGGLFRNYAVPDDHAQPGPDEVTALVAAFVDRSRIPRLEYLPELCPGVEPALLAAGFVAERHLPVLSCEPTRVAAPSAPDDVTVRLATSATELWAAAEAQNEAYGVSTTSQHDVDRLRITIERGGLVALAHTGVGVEPLDGIGAGLCAPPHAGVSELAAVGVRPAYRRRGVAAALTALLTRTCPTVGIARPFLTPAGAAEERIYRRVGYQQVSTMLHISRAG